MAYYDYDYRSRSDRSRAPRGDRMSNPSSGGVYGRRRSEGEGRYGPSSREDYDDDEDRGFFDRAGDEVRSWFGDEEAERRREHDEMMNRTYGDPRFQSNRIGFPSSYGRSSTVYRPFTDQRSGFASSRQPRDYGEHDRDYDSNYQAWRNNQMAELDRDYHEYRQENQQKFENEFGTWRQRRCSQRDCLGLVTEHMDVIGSDGEHVGKVDKVAGDRIILTKSDPDSHGTHHSIPSRWIDRVEDKVILEKTANEAHEEWRNEERRKSMSPGDENQGRGAHYLNRSFSGTY